MNLCTRFSFVAVLFASPSLAGTILVHPGDSIQAAINAANDGDEIIVAPGTYTGTGNEVVDLLGKSITLRSSNGADETTIDGQGQRSCMLIDSGETSSTLIEGFTLARGSASEGGGIKCRSSSPSITDCLFTDNFAGWGAAINVHNSDMLLTRCDFVNNHATHDAGGIYLGGSLAAAGSPVLTNCTFVGNSTSQHYGGAFRNSEGTPVFIYCTFKGNSGTWGGAIMNGGPYITVTNCSFSGNAGSHAGAIFNQNNGGYNAYAAVSNSVLCGNSPTNIWGSWNDLGGNCLSSNCNDCECMGDINSDWTVNANDLLGVLDQWNAPYDVNDVVAVLSNWGGCP